jgi:hypothetical protein
MQDFLVFGKPVLPIDFSLCRCKWYDNCTALLCYCKDVSFQAIAEHKYPPGHAYGKQFFSKWKP